MAQWNKNTQDFLNQERTLFEVNGIATRDGKIVDELNRFPVTINSDAFGRTRVSNPLTLFDSSHRYRDNNLWESLIVGTGSTVGFVTAQGLINIGIGTTAGSSVIRETTNYDPVKVKDFLKEAKLPDPRPLIYLCDMHQFIDELTRYLYNNR